MILDPIPGINALLQNQLLIHCCFFASYEDIESVGSINKIPYVVRKS